MSLTRASGAPNLLSLPAEIRRNIWLVLFQHAFLWFPHKPALLSLKPEMKENEIANLMSILYTCKTLNIEATACLTANITVDLDTSEQYFETLHYCFRHKFLSRVHHVSLANTWYMQQPRKLQMVLDTATSLRTLIIGPFPFVASYDKPEVFLEYLHGGSRGDSPRQFVEQAQNIVREFRQQLKLGLLGDRNWVGQLLDIPDRKFEILVRFDTERRLWMQGDQWTKKALVVSLTIQWLSIFTTLTCPAYVDQHRKCSDHRESCNYPATGWFPPNSDLLAITRMCSLS